MKRSLPVYMLALFVWVMGVLTVICLWDSPAPLWQKYVFTPLFLGISTFVLLKVFKVSFNRISKPPPSRRYYEKDDSRGDLL